MPDAFRITSMVPGLPERIYAAWLDSGAHTAFTGKTAKIDPTIGGKFIALDGYIHGRTIELLAGRRIVQTWRTKEFPHSAHDSRLEIQFESAEGATRLTLLHSLLPDGQGERYKKTWTDRYFYPMRNYFGRLAHGTAARSMRPMAPDPPAKAPKPGKPARPAAPPSHKTSPAKKKAAGKAHSAPARKGPSKAAARRPEKKKSKKKGRR
jgi:uncharacterized protein YndB with AHSA1/START domain